MNGNFTVSTKRLKSAAMQYKEISGTLTDCVRRLESVRNNLDGSYGDIRSTIKVIEETQKNRIKNLQAMEKALYSIIQMYEQTEKKISISIGEGNIKSIEDMLKEFGGELQDAFTEDFKGNLFTDLLSAMLESGGNTAVRIGGLINVATSTARGVGDNAFVMLNPNVAVTTSKVIKGGELVATGAKWGFPIVGGLLDFGGQLMEGEEIKDAAIKAGAHVGIGIGAGAAAGALVGSIIPGAGTAAGAVIGAAVQVAFGTALTIIGSEGFDYVYDNWDDVKKTASDTWNKITDGTSKAWEKTTGVIRNAAEDIGDAVSGFWGNFGTAFGT